MQKFYENTIVSKFIKCLLSTFDIPTINTCTDEDKLIPYNLYIKDNFIVKVLPEFDSDGKHKIDTIEPYEFGKNYPGLTTRYESNIVGYDSKTHYYLGQYLRALRDLKGVDLMPFYNCYNSTYLRDIEIIESNNSYSYKVITDPRSISNDYKTIAIPIKFDKTYTIALDCTVPYMIMPIIYGNKGIVHDLAFDELSKENILKINSSYFDKPYTYKISWSDYAEKRSRYTNYQDICNKLAYEKFLYLVIQLPNNIKTTITILEGDYTNVSVLKIVNTSSAEFTQLSDSDLNNILLSDLTLLNRNDSNSYAFSDRLIEYLLLNVIDKNEDISQNIARIQTYTSSLTNQNINNYPRFISSVPKGVWTRDLRTYLYYLTMNNSRLINKFDITGFVDKDIEKIITKGQGD